MANYEIELRGILTPKKRDKLEKLLIKSGKKIRSYERTQWVLKDSWKNGLDLRIKKTNGILEFSLKIGNPGVANRKEISLELPNNKFSEAKDFMKLLGYKKGIKAIRNANIYKYSGVEWAIIEIPGHGYYFEAERIAKNKKEHDRIENEIREIAESLGLKVLTSKETMDYIAKLDKEANELFEWK
jgi:predicted adenylyl cyclase CyaB